METSFGAECDGIFINQNKTLRACDSHTIGVTLTSTIFPCSKSMENFHDFKELVLTYNYLSGQRLRFLKDSPLLNRESALPLFYRRSPSPSSIYGGDQTDLHKGKGFFCCGTPALELPHDRNSIGFISACFSKACEKQNYFRELLCDLGIGFNELLVYDFFFCLLNMFLLFYYIVFIVLLDFVHRIEWDLSQKVGIEIK